ncbi:hypothetical protein CC2G_001406 [Coprinopsis cinerea AmutBmut pab1-1]|nr:hypothetical protein CC2G_001406 [Coprinopsis cinerea AmutBmut pab1-1]
MADQPVDPPQTLFHDLPEDILLQIFHAAREVAFGRTARALSLVTLSQVCREWRNLAISAPSLWTEIQYPGPRGHNYLSNLFLERSRPCCELDVHIKISMRVEQRSDGEIVRHPKPVMQDVLQVLKEADRIRSLSLVLPETKWTWDPTYRAIQATPFPNLVILNVSGDELPWSWWFVDGRMRSRHQGGIHTQLTLPTPRKLKSLTIHNHCWLCHAHPFRDLTYLRLNYFSPTFAEFTELFRSSPKLHTLILLDFGMEIGTDELAAMAGGKSVEREVIAPSLTTLVVGSYTLYEPGEERPMQPARDTFTEKDCESTSCPCFFRGMTANRLRNLEILTPSSISATHFLSMLRRRADASSNATSKATAIGSGTGTGHSQEDSDPGITVKLQITQRECVVGPDTGEGYMKLEELASANPNTVHIGGYSALFWMNHWPRAKDPRERPRPPSR